MRRCAKRSGMSRPRIMLPVVVALIGTTSPLHAQTKPANGDDQTATADPEPKLPALRKELLARFKKDQDARQKMIDWQKESGLVLGSPEFFEQAASMIETGKEIDEENSAWLKTVLDEHGWPGRSLVGRDGAQAAFILAQHADRDRPLQKRSLKLMQQAPPGEVQPQNLALLTDRVLLAEGKPQRYGSQVEFVDGQWRPRPVEDPQHLDERRKSVGLPPIDEYLQVIAEVYGIQPANSTAQ